VPHGKRLEVMMVCNSDRTRRRRCFGRCYDVKTVKRR